jgi:hypothetical protein
MAPSARHNTRLDQSGASQVEPRAMAGTVAADKEPYVCVRQRSRPQVNRRPLGSREAELGIGLRCHWLREG